MSVVRHGDAIYGYTCGWSRRVSVSVETAIGLAISRDDGMTFQRLGPGPVLSSSLHEPCLVGDGFVRIVGDQFHMWYIFGIGWKRFAPDVPPDRLYKIGHAVSLDGIAWVKEEARQIIPDRLGPDESQALPSVIEIGGRYHMFFCYRQSFDFRTNADRGYRIGHAYSDDLDGWTRDDDPFLDVGGGRLGLGHAVLPACLRMRWPDPPALQRQRVRALWIRTGGPRDMSASVVFATNTATVSEIAEHLSRCDDTFVPPLSRRTEIGAYARKIGQQAERFEAWASGTLVGLVAVYCNDAERRTAYVTNVSVEPGFRRSGIASGLIANCIEGAMRAGFAGIELEVDGANEAAIDLYRKHGFAVRGARDGIVVMYRERGTEQR